MCPHRHSARPASPLYPAVFHILCISVNCFQYCKTNIARFVTANCAPRARKTQAAESETRVWDRE